MGPCGWSQLRWRAGGSPSSNGISQCSVLYADWTALHYSAGGFSRLHAAIHLFCLQDHPSENFHRRLRTEEQKSRSRCFEGLSLKGKMSGGARLKDAVCSFKSIVSLFMLTQTSRTPNPTEKAQRLYIRALIKS